MRSLFVEPQLLGLDSESVICISISNHTISQYHLPIYAYISVVWLSYVLRAYE